MRYRSLGRTGIKVSPYALGALALGTSIGNPDHDDSVRIIHKALDAGINLIDTADAYGESEVVVGQALKGHRDSVVLATKFGRPTGDDPNQQGASRRWILTAAENSLRCLQTDYVDLYQVHRPDPATAIEETLSALSDLIHAGKVRAIGASGTPASGIIEAHWAAERHGLERFRTEQPPYSILSRGIEREVLPVAQRYGMGILVWGPLAQGMLTGRIRKGQQTDLRRAARSRPSATSAGSTPSSSSSHSPTIVGGYSVSYDRRAATVGIKAPVTGLASQVPGPTVPHLPPTSWTRSASCRTSLTVISLPR